MKVITLAAVALALAPPGSRADELHDSRAEVDEVVADTRTPAPLRKVAAPIPFENFRYPHVDDAENVIFIGNDYYTFGARSGTGIFRSQASDGKIEPLVLHNDPSPDDGEPVGIILGLQTDRQSFVYHRGPDRGSGIYARFSDGPLLAIANRRTPAPGTAANFSWFWYADIHDARVVFHGSTGAEGSSREGLYLYDHGEGKIRRLVDSTQPAPAAGGARLGELSYQPRIDASWLVFSANRRDPEDGLPLPGRGILGWQIEGVSGDPFGMESLQLLAPFGMEIPESGGRPLTAAPNPVVDRGIVATVAGSDPQRPQEETTAWQSILIRTEDGRWICPVDTNTRIPYRADGACFTGFNKWLAVQDGRVIFRAHGPDGYEAVYLYEPSSDHLIFVVDTSAPLEGKTIAGFELGRYPMVGARLAMMIRFTDRSSGVYLATLHALPTAVTRRGAAE